MAKDIAVALTLDNKQFNKGIAQSEKKVDQFSKNSTSGLTKIGAALAALGGASVAKGIIQVGSSFQDLQNSLNVVFGSVDAGAQAFKQVEQFAASTQFSVQTLTGAFIQLKGAGIEPTEELLQTFADTASISTDQAGTLTAALDLLTRTTSGGLGIVDLQRLQDRGVPVFRILEDRIGKTRGQLSEFGKTAKGARIITDALLAGLKDDFGGALKTQVGLLNFELNQLGDATDKLSKALFDTFSEDAATGVQDLTSAISKLADNIEPLLKLGKGLAQIATVALFFIPAARGFKLAAKGLAESMRAINLAAKKAGGGLSLLAATGPKLGKGLTKLGKTAKTKLLSPFKSVWNSLGRLTQRNGAFVEEFDKTGKLIGKIWKGDVLSPLGRTRYIALKAGEGFAWIAATTLGFLGLKNAIQGANQIMDDFAKMGPPRELFDADQLKKAGEEYDKLTDNDTLFDPIKGPELGAEFSKLKDSIADITSFDQFDAVMIQTIELMKQSKLSTAEYELALKLLRESVAELNPYLEVFKDAVNEAGNALGDDLAEALVEGEGAMEAFKNSFKTVIKQVLAEAIKLLFVKQLISGLFGLGGYDVEFGSGSSIAGITKQKVPGAYQGGSVSGNSPYMVGEQGPELFVPSTNGNIIPNGAGGGSAPVTNNYITNNINAMDSRSVAQVFAENSQTLLGTVEFARKQTAYGR